MTGTEVWQSIVGAEHGAVVQAALAVLSGVPASVCADAITRINRETSIGPMLNPTAYIGGERFRNASNYVDVLNKLHGLLEVLNREVPAAAP